MSARCPNLWSWKFTKTIIGLTRPYRYIWPLNLAVMNTEVNSGGGRAEEFIKRMAIEVPFETTDTKASWFVDQQTEFYYKIAAANPKLEVFLHGWQNRSDYMQDVIAGVISLTRKPSSDGHAKAFTEGDLSN